MRATCRAARRRSSRRPPTRMRVPAPGRRLGARRWRRRVGRGNRAGRDRGCGRRRRRGVGWSGRWRGGWRAGGVSDAAAVVSPGGAAGPRPASSQITSAAMAPSATRTGIDTRRRGASAAEGAGAVVAAGATGAGLDGGAVAGLAGAAARRTEASGGGRSVRGLAGACSAAKVIGSGRSHGRRVGLRRRPSPWPASSTGIGGCRRPGSSPTAARPPGARWLRRTPEGSARWS